VKNAVPALLCVAASFATSVGAAVDPAPILRAEYAFAAAAASRGIRDAFLEYAAADGVLFRPRAVNAHEFMSAAPAAQSRLEWYPAFAALAASGELGFTTGPWVARREANGPAVAQGHYLTVWKEQPGGAWRYVLDHGVSHEATGAQPAALSAGTESGSDPKFTTFSRRDTALDELARANDDLDAALIVDGPLVLADYLDDMSRLYREGSLPVLGAAAAREFLADDAGRIAAQRAGIDVARSGELGYTYGYGRTTQDDATGNLVYVRIWQRVGGAWRILVDLETPLP
jgi:ketosteroid isomerase-like protein